MGKLNEGDVIEGIFTIGLSLYIAYDKVEKAKLNKIRTEIDTNMFNTGRFTYMVAENLPKQKKGHSQDLFNVGFEMRLKPKSVTGAFGKDYHDIYYKSSKDIGNIDKKVDQFINSINYGNFTRRVTKIIDQFLDNNKEEEITFIVIADGIEGEQSGGLVKGDVKLEVYAKIGKQMKRIDFGTIPFSLKSESVTVASLSPYNGMVAMANALGVTWDGEERYQRLSKPFYGETEQQAKFEMIVSMYNDLKKGILMTQSEGTFSTRAFDFLEKNLFGEDMADVIDVQKGTVKEITVENYKKLKANVKLFVRERGNYLEFVSKEDQKTIFHIRTKLRKPPANEAKFYLEVGKGIYL
jgi:hypothetical protein